MSMPTLKKKRRRNLSIRKKNRIAQPKVSLRSDIDGCNTQLVRMSPQEFPDREPQKKELKNNLTTSIQYANALIDMVQYSLVHDVPEEACQIHHALQYPVPSKQLILYIIIADDDITWHRCRNQAARLGLYSQRIQGQMPEIIPLTLQWVQQQGERNAL